jgi:hypothetical protein
MTPVGWLGVQHVHGISRSANDPNRDVASLDLEIAILWAIWRQKIKNTEAFKGQPDPKTSTDMGWDHLAGALAELEEEAKEGMDPGLEAAKRLEIRVLQLQVLMASAVECGLTDMAHLPKDVFNARSK